MLLASRQQLHWICGCAEVAKKSESEAGEAKKNLVCMGNREKVAAPRVNQCY